MVIYNCCLFSEWVCIEGYVKFWTTVYEQEANDYVEYTEPSTPSLAESKAIWVIKR